MTKEMTIDESIEINTALEEHGAEVLTTPEKYALRLGIEALKHIRNLRILYRPTGRNEETLRLLPGETEEGGSVETITAFREGGIRITDIKAIQAGFIRPVQDTLIVYLNYSVIGQPDFIFTVTLPFTATLNYLRQNGKDNFLAQVLGKADDVLSERAEAELDASERAHIRLTQERQKELDALVSEIKSEIGLLD